MTAPRRPPGLLFVGGILSLSTLVLAAKAMVFFPMAVVSAAWIAFFVVPPEHGVTARHYQFLVALLLVSALVTYYWQRSWSAF